VVRTLASGVVVVLLGACGTDELTTGTTLDVCTLVPPAQVEQAVGSKILLKPIVPKVDVRRPDLGGVLLDLFADADSLDRSPTPTRTDRVAVQGLCGYVFVPDAPSSTSTGGAIQSLVVGVYPVAGDASAWLDTTARQLADQVLIRSGTVPTVSPTSDLGDGSRLVTTGTGAIVLAVDGGTGVVVEGSAIDVAALTTVTRAALAAATAASAAATSAP
jgi:hypothetical protein